MSIDRQQGTSPTSPTGSPGGSSGAAPSSFAAATIASFRFHAKCPKCAQEFPKPPRNWDCPRCNIKTWQPDETTDACEVCKNAVAKFTRHHCRSCGLVTCTACTGHQTVIPEFGPEKQRICKRCAVPNVPPVKEGYLQKLTQKSSFFGEKLQSRYFELRGTILLYGKEKGGVMNGQVDVTNCKVMDIAIHPNAFCLIGPRLQRGYVISADSAETKAEWISAIQKQVAIQQAQSSPNGNGGRGNDDEEEESRTEAVIFDASAGDAPSAPTSVSMQDFDVLTVLGLGSFGRVMKVKHRRTGLVYAMKVLDKQQIINNKMVTHTQAEKRILQDMQHPFIVKLHYAFQTKKHLVLVLDFLCGGELFFHLQRNKRFTESRAKFYAAEIGLALEHIHKHNIIYRDLKPENLVLDRFGHVTLTDFGLAKRDVKDLTHTFCGTPEYMAPELIQKRGHTKSVDWWSLGIFLYEMVHGLPPFYTQNVTDMYDMILNRPLTFPSHFSQDLRSLLTRLLERDPTKRLQSGDEFRRHPFFRDIDWDRVLAKDIAPEFVPDIGNNDLKYIDKQFTQESTKVAQLDIPCDPEDPSAKKFADFEFTNAAAISAATAKQQQPSSSSPLSPRRQQQQQQQQQTATVIISDDLI